MSRTLDVAIADIPSDAGLIVEVDADLRIAVYRMGEAFHAIDNRCPHAGGSLGDGPFDGRNAMCPLHRFKVDVTTGRCPNSPFLRVTTYPVKRVGERLEIAV